MEAAAGAVTATAAVRAARPAIAAPIQRQTTLTASIAGSLTNPSFKGICEYTKRHRQSSNNSGANTPAAENTNAGVNSPDRTRNASSEIADRKTWLQYHRAAA